MTSTNSSRQPSRANFELVQNASPHKSGKILAFVKRSGLKKLFVLKESRILILIGMPPGWI
jgi:hypothetical protein